jgi:hypothetical protein
VTVSTSSMSIRMDFSLIVFPKFLKMSILEPLRGTQHVAVCLYRVT